jgi:hypothetical protein
MPMVNVSTLLYLCDNLDDETEEIFDIEGLFKSMEDDYPDIRNYLDNQILEADRALVEKVLAQISQL